MMSQCSTDTHASWRWLRPRQKSSENYSACLLLALTKNSGFVLISLKRFWMSASVEMGSLST